LKLGKACGFDGIPMNVSDVSQKTSCAFNTFIQSLPSPWSLPGTLEEGKNHNSAKTQQGPKIYPKFMSAHPLVHHRQTI
jgi:hypothetical protein